MFQLQRRADRAACRNTLRRSPPRSKTPACTQLASAASKAFSFAAVPRPQPPAELRTAPLGCSCCFPQEMAAYPARRGLIPLSPPSHVHGVRQHRSLPTGPATKRVEDAGMQSLPSAACGIKGWPWKDGHLWESDGVLELPRSDTGA